MYKDKAQQREYQRNWMAKRRADYFADKVCIRCGSKENLELDNKDKNTKVSHRIWSWSAAKRKAELEKCQPLCFNCHLYKSNEERTKPASHGEFLMYRHGCRCDLCKASNTAYKREQDIRLNRVNHG